MSVAVKASRSSVWLDGLGEWSWPGQRAASSAAAEMLPPPWVPTFPPQPAAAPATPTTGARTASGARTAGFLLRLALCCLAAMCAVLAQGSELPLERLAGVRVEAAQEGPADALAPTPQPLPTVARLSGDHAGSTIEGASYYSRAIHGHGSFLVYLPPHFSATAVRYPVLYMLTGDDQSDRAFLEVGLQRDLDQLIAAGRIPPLIAVMIQGGPGANLWRNQGKLGYESYILEVQELVDRMLPSEPKRDARAIVGDSMGGYGAMNAALSNPYLFGTVESWIGFFNGLGADLHADSPIFKRLGLHAFVYGAEEDRIANPNEDLPFAHALRSAGADAAGAIYPGEHNLETVEAHLTSMLAFAGSALPGPR